MTKAKDLSAHERKDAHLDLAKSPAAQAQISHPLDDITLPHHALPDIALSQIDLGTRFCGRHTSVPFFIGAMTGGTDRADKINHALAEVAAQKNIALALGSQRACLATGRDQSFFRKIAPKAVLIGNLGITQLAAKGGQDMAMRAIEAIDATAMAIHLNPLQEAAQPEGDHDWSGCAQALSHFIENAPVPVIVKEVGAGISAKLATQLDAMGASYIDLAGLGGTNWTRIEAARHQDPHKRRLFAPFLDWGIDSATALSDARSALPQARLIASGGIRHGLDVAKSLALGANMVAAAGPFLKALEGDDGIISQTKLANEIDLWTQQLRLACFLTNSKKPSDLAKISPVIN